MVLGTRYYTSGGRSKHASDTSVLANALRDVELVFKESDARSKEERYKRGIQPDAVSFIEHGPVRIILSATPTDESLPSYVRMLDHYHVSHVVRVCEAHYNAVNLKNQGFHHHHWSFKDGESPPADITQKWLHLLDNVFDLRSHSNQYTSDYKPSTSASDSSDELESIGDSSVHSYTTNDIHHLHSLNTSPNSSTDSQQHHHHSNTSGRKASAPKKCIAIHCAAGLGRAPVLVAIALIELGLSAHEAIGWIRAIRRGAINGLQLSFLQQYRTRCEIEAEEEANHYSSKCKMHKLGRKNRRSRSPFSFWRKGTNGSKTPPSPSSSSSTVTQRGISSVGLGYGRHESPVRSALQIYDEQEQRRASHDRTVVWADEKRSSQPSSSSNGSTSGSSHHALKAMRKAQVKKCRYVSM